SPSTYVKSEGKSASIGSSVDPGFPKIVVMPRARNSSKAASRIVVVVRASAVTPLIVPVAVCAIGLPPLFDGAEPRSMLREPEDRIEVEIAVIGAEALGDERRGRTAELGCAPAIAPEREGAEES